MRSLWLQHSDVQDLSPLAALSGSLRELSLLGSSSVQDISVLSGLGKLRELNLVRTRVTDIEPLRRLSSGLVRLLLPSSRTLDLSPVAALVNLEHLHAAAYTSEQVAQLSGLTALRKLVLGPEKRVGETLDVSPLASLLAL